MKNEPDAAVLGRQQPADADTTQPWQLADRMVVELAPGLMELLVAVQEHDDEQIWHLHRQVADQVTLLDWVAGSVSQHTVQRTHPRDRARVSAWNQQLFLAPVVTTAPAETGPGVDSQRPQALLAKLAGWAGPQQAVSLCTTLVPYADVCRWSPLTQREMLMQLECEKPRIQAPWSTHQLSLVEGLPHLSFVVGGLRRWLAQPDMPHTTGAEQVSLRAMVAAHAAFAQQVPLHKVQAAAPQIPQEAVLCGLQQWLSACVATGRVLRWDVANGPQDVVELVLFAQDDQILAVTPVRLHQLPPCALDLLLEQLAREVAEANPLGCR
jgi:hypothetical protein